MRIVTMDKKRPITADQQGLSLVELMVAIAIGLLLLAGLTGMFVNTSQSNIELQRAGQQLENGRYAVQMLYEDLHHAGYYGEFYQLPAATALPDPCAMANPGLQDSLALPMQGYDAPGASPLACLPNTEFVPGTDILVVRRAQTAPLAAAGELVDKEVYIQARFDTAEIQFGNPVDFVLGKDKANSDPATILKKDGVTAADIRKFNVHIYFVSPCSGASCAASNDGIPTLKRLELTSVGGATAFRTVALAEGIENFQVDYGIDNAPAVTNPVTGQTGDGAPDVYVKAPALTDWPNVVAVKIHVLARNTEPTGGYTDEKKYDLGLAGIVQPGGPFKRHAYSALVRLVNQSGRRES